MILRFVFIFVQHSPFPVAFPNCPSVTTDSWPAAQVTRPLGCGISIQRLLDSAAVVGFGNGAMCVQYEKLEENDVAMFKNFLIGERSGNCG